MLLRVARPWGHQCLLGLRSADIVVLVAFLRHSGSLSDLLPSVDLLYLSNLVLRPAALLEIVHTP